MDMALILAAFGLGFLGTRVGLPPLVGYLAAGFALHALGYRTTDAIEWIADLGVVLLLFGIGLKLKLATLTRPEVWAGAGIHLIASTSVIGGLLLLLGTLGLSLAVGLTAAEAALLGFAFSFSSTVFAVKMLELRNETASLSGRLAVGILIMQDVLAVLFLAFSSGDLPSPWSIPVVIAVVAARPLYGWLLAHSGRGELMVMLGFSLAIGVGAGAFEQVGLEPDLGALIVGLTLAGHAKASELADRLLGFKDILLVGFFLSIGLGGAPSPGALGVALIVVALVPFKAAGFLVLLSRFRLRARTSLHTSLTLGTYSEFGLIVAAAAVREGMLAAEWTAAVAVAVAASFAVAAPANAARYAIYQRWSNWLGRVERHPIRADDALIDPGQAQILVFGMGRVGAGAYDELARRRGDSIIGVDRRDENVSANRAEGRRMIRGDALDWEFWERMRLHPGIQLVVLAMSDHEANVEASRRVRDCLPRVRIAATASYPDEVRALEQAGVDVARNLYGEAGQGLADDACDLLAVSPA
jgi:predicted Kef-type K+ transport protein